MSASHHRPIPVARRPFPKESIGSWIGRLAAYYAMSIDEFAKHFGIELPVEANNVGWMLMPPLLKQTVKQIAQITRMQPRDIEAIQTPREWAGERAALHVCAGCLFINPLDARAPYWQRAWLSPDPRGARSTMRSLIG